MDADNKSEQSALAVWEKPAIVELPFDMRDIQNDVVAFDDAFGAPVVPSTS